MIEMDYDLILHIGANKTGSSAIQTFIRNNLRVLADKGFLMPDKDMRIGGKILGYQVFKLAELFESGTESLEWEFDNLMKYRKGRTVLISAENMSNMGNYNFFTGIGKKYKTKVIFYIRRQDELLTSSWQQWHSKANADLSDWLGGAVNTIGQWEATVQGWENAVGENGTVELGVFDRYSFTNHDINYDFLEKIGFEATEFEEFNFDSESVNPSYSNIITSLAAGNPRLFRDVHDDDFYKFVVDLLGDGYAKGEGISLITKEQREFIHAHYFDQNERVRAKYFPDREKLFNDLDHMKYIYAEDLNLPKLQTDLIVSLLYKLYLRYENDKRN